MNRRKLPAVLLILLTALLTAGAAMAQKDAVIKGKTQKATWIGGQCKYEPLPNVQIEVFRLGPVGGPKQSGGTGDFNVPVTAGSPFRVLFYLDEKTVPELQNLSGESGVLHTFNVGLLTVAEYDKFVKAELLPPLKQHLAAILAVLPKSSVAFNQVQLMFSRLP